MNKNFLILAIFLITGSFETAGSFQIDDYKAYWLRNGKELLMIDNENRCLFNNTGTPKDCNDKERNLIKKYFKLK